MFKAFVSFASLVAVAGLMTAPAATRADILVQFTENTITNQTSFVVSGGLNTSAFPAPTTANSLLLTQVSAAAALTSGPGILPVNSHTFDFVQAIGAVAIISSGTYVGPDVFGWIANGSNDQLYLPANYLSNTPISCGGVFNGRYSNLSINPSTVVMNLPGSQSITVQFATVPAPGAVAVLGLGGMVAMGWRRRR